MEIKCSVENCSFNSKLECTARIIEVNCDDTTMLAANTEETCCGTFTPIEAEDNHREEVDHSDINVNCTVANCEFFKSLKCVAPSIEVNCDDGSTIASHPKETCCDTFIPWGFNKDEEEAKAKTYESNRIQQHPPPISH